MIFIFFLLVLNVRIGGMGVTYGLDHFPIPYQAQQFVRPGFEFYLVTLCHLNFSLFTVYQVPMVNFNGCDFVCV